MNREGGGEGGEGEGKLPHLTRLQSVILFLITPAMTDRFHVACWTGVDLYIPSSHNVTTGQSLDICCNKAVLRPR